MSKNGYTNAAITRGNTPETLEHTVPTNGQYYIRADLVSNTSKYEKYKMNISVNGNPVIVDYNSATTVA